MFHAKRPSFFSQVLLHQQVKAGIPPDGQPPRVNSEPVIFVCVPDTSNEIDRRMSSSLFSHFML